MQHQTSSPGIDIGWFTLKRGESMAYWHLKCREFNGEDEYDTCLEIRPYTCTHFANYGTTPVDHREAIPCANAIVRPHTLTDEN